MGAASEPLSPRFHRQRSPVSDVLTRCWSTFCCYDSDDVFSSSPLKLHPHRSNVTAWHDVRLLGSRRKVAIPVQGVHDEVDAVLTDDLYTRPSRWRLFLRKLRAETRRMNCSRPSPSGFQYDALSYALNFDDGYLQQQQALSRSTSAAFMESLPSVKVTAS